MSYKYHDGSVRQFKGRSYGETTVRNYVDVISEIIEETGKYYYRGEDDGEDLSHLNYKTVERILADKMFYTSITLVLISPDMFENVQEIEQWIPWEISYSLRNKTRIDGNSNMNAILAIVLPDRNGSYDYAMYKSGRGYFVRSEAFFEIIHVNMFNRKGAMIEVDDHDNMKYLPGNSYVALARWDDFRSNPEHYMDLALANRWNWDRFDIVKKIDEDWVS